MMPLLIDGMGAERLLQSCALTRKQHSPRRERRRFHQLHQTARRRAACQWHGRILAHKAGKNFFCLALFWGRLDPAMASESMACDGSLQAVDLSG
jgi:hypothetical protein